MKCITDLELIIGCQQAVHRFYAELDASNMDAVAGAMAPAGIWYRQGKKLQGPEAVFAALKRRPAGRHTAHLVQNLVVDIHSLPTVCVRYMTLVYRFDATELVEGPVSLGVPISISLHHDKLQRDPSSSWLFVEKCSERKFAS